MNTIQIAVFCFACLVLGDGYPQLSKSNDIEIVGGKDIDISKVPYIAAFLGAESELYCGSVIISDSYLLTAAHCCNSVESGKFRVGSNFWFQGGKVYLANRFVIHPKHYPSDIPNYDVCVVELEEKLSFEKNVKPIKIAEGLPATGQIVMTSGWGATEENGLISNHVKAVKIPIVDHKKCFEAYPDVNDTSDFLCASATGKDSCQGDSGGPLVYQEELIGLTSFGKGCAEKNYPGVYADLTRPVIRQFIKAITGV